LTEHVGRELGALVREVAPERQQWSAGGGLHFSAAWRSTGAPVIVKLGADANQLYWTREVAAAAPDLVPALYASGDRLGELPVGWTVMERAPFGSLGPDWGGAEFGMLLEAAVRFQRAARGIEPRHVRIVDAGAVRRWLEEGLTSEPPGPAQRVVDRVEHDFAWVASVCEIETCHGDVHMCNAVTRTPPGRGDALLIDCQPAVQPWAFDAAYPQVLNSIDKRRAGYTGLVPEMARIRSEYGMGSVAGRDLERLSRICLAWFAIRLWGLSPGRHTIQDYREETERYVVEGASLPD
jgi:hypothetical protein